MPLFNCTLKSCLLRKETRKKNRIEETKKEKKKGKNKRNNTKKKESEFQHNPSPNRNKKPGMSWHWYQRLVLRDIAPLQSFPSNKPSGRASIHSKYISKYFIQWGEKKGIKKKDRGREGDREKSQKQILKKKYIPHLENWHPILLLSRELWQSPNALVYMQYAMLLTAWWFWYWYQCLVLIRGIQPLQYVS